MNQTENEWIQHPTVPEKHQTGQFITPTIAKLRKVIPKPSDNKLPEFIIYVRDCHGYDDKYFDTSSLQLMDYPTNKPVMFQVASNFNCQENGAPMINLKTSNYLTHLMSDSTQGPSASCGAIIRLMYHLSNTINLLNQTVYGSHVIEGKLYAPKHIVDLDIESVQIGLHTDVSANFDRSSLGPKCMYYETGKIIDQVFTSTLIYPTDYHQELTHQFLLFGYISRSTLSTNRDIGSNTGWRRCISKPL